MMYAGDDRLATEPIERHESMNTNRPKLPCEPLSGVNGAFPVSACDVTANVVG
jgi:hypothetical protein